jgi:hypothetical protein
VVAKIYRRIPVDEKDAANISFPATWSKPAPEWTGLLLFGLRMPRSLL